MGRFWDSSRAPAYSLSALLLGGLCHACSLNPQPAPPAKDELHDPSASATSGSSNSSAATSTTGVSMVDPTTSGTTGGVDDSNGDGVIDSEDDPTAESPVTGTTGSPSPEGGALDGTAGAAGAPAEAPQPANGPH